MGLNLLSHYTRAITSFVDGGLDGPGPERARNQTLPITVPGSHHSWTAGRQRYTRAFKGLGAGSAMHSPRVISLSHTKDGGPGRYPRALTLPRHWFGQSQS